jgi:predicted negative regulator of RcsB-dependent stress response
MNNTQSKQNLTAILIGIIILLLGAVGYLWYNLNKVSNKSQVQQTEMMELQKVQAELDQDYQAALESLEEMRGSNTQLNALIDSQKEELKAQKEKINGLIWTKKELDKARAELKTLNVNVAKYLADIQQLKEENKILTEDNSKLSQNLEAEVKAKEGVIEERNSLTQEKENLSKTNAALGSKVDMANSIKINFMEVKGYEVRDGGKLKEKSKAKDIEMLRVCFLTETNMVTPSGQKKFFIRIINPLGETVAVDDQGAGVLTNKLDNSQVRYTTSGDITYKNEDTNACIDWTVPNALAKGDYKIEMYNNGFLVGKGQFKLK